MRMSSSHWIWASSCLGAEGRVTFLLAWCCCLVVEPEFRAWDTPKFYYYCCCYRQVVIPSVLILEWELGCWDSLPAVAGSCGSCGGWIWGFDSFSRLRVCGLESKSVMNQKAAFQLSNFLAVSPSLFSPFLFCEPVHLSSCLYCSFHGISREWNQKFLKQNFYNFNPCNYDHILFLITNIG